MIAVCLLIVVTFLVVVALGAFAWKLLDAGRLWLAALCILGEFACAFGMIVGGMALTPPSSHYTCTTTEYPGTIVTMCH